MASGAGQGEKIVMVCERDQCRKLKEQNFVRVSFLRSQLREDNPLRFK